MRESTLEVTVADAEAMRSLGARLASALPPGDSPPFVAALSGDLGAGKTTFVGGLLSALGHDGPARSPTYALLEPYRLSGRDIVHADLYRLRVPEEIEDLGLRDLLVPGAVLLVEWPERGGDGLGAIDLRFSFTYADAGRRVRIEAASDAGADVLGRLRLDGR